MKYFMLHIFLYVGLTISPALRGFEPYRGNLEIHYINVGQGGSTLIIGPNGTSILYDFGNYNGTRDILPYLSGLPRLTRKTIDYTILSHNDKDHYMGYYDTFNLGEFDVRIANYYSGDTTGFNSLLIQSRWAVPASKTTAGSPTAIPVGLTISIGDGAYVKVMAANGKIFGKKNRIAIQNKNDASVALFISYKNFQYILDGDLGGGAEACTSRNTVQKNLQDYVADQLIAEKLMTAQFGVDVMHIAHHGSESSTSSYYYNKMLPEVGLISVGEGNSRYRHPRKDVVYNVLLGEIRPSCVKAPKLKYLFQTERGDEGIARTGETSNLGIVAGDIRISTNGDEFYTIFGSGRIHVNGKETFQYGHSSMNVTKGWKVCLDEILDHCNLNN